MVHISSKEIDIEKVLKINNINSFCNLFPYYDFGEKYRDNGQNDSLLSSH